MKRIFNTRLLFFHLGLRRRADLDHRNTAGELGQTFLSFSLS